jgi:hypothetical protein
MYLGDRPSRLSYKWKRSESESLGGLSAAWYIDLATVGSGVKNIRLVFQIVEMLDDERRSILRGIFILRHTSISENMFK